MKVLMLCWEYPPKISGGLGVACKGLAEALAKKGHHVTVLLPKIEKIKSVKNVTFVDLSKRKLPSKFEEETILTEEIVSSIQLGKSVLPYLPPKFFKTEKKVQKSSKVIREIKPDKIYEEFPLTGDYSDKLMIEIKLYALLVGEFIWDQKFDVVHCHDWMTFPAGSLTSKLGLKTIGHVHSTERERNGAFINPEVVDIEKNHLPEMDHVFAVSKTSSHVIREDYGIPNKSITVVPNGGSSAFSEPGKGTKIGFIGRFTHQKAPGVFVEVARSLKSFDNSLSFTMAGDGYLESEIQEKAHQINLSESLEMTGFLSGKKLDKWYSQLSILIVPSTSEPFGLVALEAIQAGVAVIISKGAGITEFIPSLIQVPHWNQHEFYMAAGRLLENDKKRIAYIHSCQKQAKKLTWENSASLAEVAYT